MPGAEQQKRLSDRSFRGRLVELADEYETLEADHRALKAELCRLRSTFFDAKRDAGEGKESIPVDVCRHSERDVDTKAVFPPSLEEDEIFLELPIPIQPTAASIGLPIRAYPANPSNVSSLEKYLPTPQFDDSGVKLPPSFGDDCNDLKLPASCEENRTSLILCASATDTWDKLEDYKVSARWLSLTNGLLGTTADPKEDALFDISAVRAWRRWVLLSDHLVRFYKEGRAPSTIRGEQIKFDLLSVWLWRTRNGNGHFKESFALDTVRTKSSAVGDMLTDDNWILEMCIIHPHSAGLLFWISLGGFAVLFDVYMIPLDVSGLATAPSFITAASCVFWIIDFFICCLTGIETKECLVDMRIGTILRIYLRSWLVPDLLVIVIDMFLLGMDGGVYGSLRANKMVRLIRLIRLLRLRKMEDAWRSLTNSIYVAYAVMLGKCLKYMLLIFTFNHYVACLWYGIATWSQTRGERTWLEGLQHTVDGNAASYVYSLHWALTQISPATQNISAQNTYERTFALIVSLFALVAFSSFISQLTNALNQLLRCKNEQDRQEHMLRDFFRSRGTTTQLGSQIMSFFRQRLAAVKRVTEEEVTFFAEVPESTMVLLHEEMYLHVLLENRFFYEFYGAETHGTLLKICHTAMRELSAHPSQDIFITSSNATSVFSLRSGKMIYKHRQHEYDICPESWLSEMGLWIKWQHVGTLTAAKGSRCDLSAIHLNNLQSIFVAGGEPLYHHFRCMAVFTVEQVELAASQGSWPTDLPISSQLKATICWRVAAFVGFRTAWFEDDGGRRSSRSSRGSQVGRVNSGRKSIKNATRQRKYSVMSFIGRGSS